MHTEQAAGPDPLELRSGCLVFLTMFTKRSWQTWLLAAGWPVALAFLLLWNSDSSLWGGYRPEYGGTFAEWIGGLGTIGALGYAARQLTHQREESADEDRRETFERKRTAEEMHCNWSFEETDRLFLLALNNANNRTGSIVRDLRFDVEFDRPVGLSGGTPQREHTLHLVTELRSDINPVRITANLTEKFPTGNYIRFDKPEDGSGSWVRASLTWTDGHSERIGWVQRAEDPNPAIEILDGV